jgi:pSer/pThr/pTyr-binding forkhead associated (FHA) protein
MDGDDRTVLEDERELCGWLAVLNGQCKGRDFRLLSGKTVAGSSRYADIHIPDPQLESHHFSIRIHDREIWLTDLDSDPGLFVGEKRIHREKIADETLFKASNIEFLVKLL